MERQMDPMEIAISEAQLGMEANEGGPFGAVIVQKGKIIAAAHNEVIKTNDPTAHAEIQAIRKTTTLLKRFDLSDCEMYTTCEPCIMCLGAIYWAKFAQIYYGCTRQDTVVIGFDDDFIFKDICRQTREKRVVLIPHQRKLCLPLFDLWKKKSDKVQY